MKSGELDFNIVTDTEEKITTLGLENSSAKIVPSGTLLIALYGATVGKLAFLGTDAATNQAVASIFTTESFEKKYLYYYLINNRERLLQKRIGGAQPNISQKILNDFPIPVAPIDEQKRIVLKLEELLSSMEKSKELLNLTLNKLGVYKKLLLKNAFEGKLTNEWRNINKQKKFFKNNISETKSFKAQLFDIESSNLMRLPKSWLWLKLKDIAREIDYGFSEKSNTEPIGPKFLRITDIQNNHVDWDSVPYCKISDKRKAKYLLKEGDLLFARTGATVGKSYLIKSIPNEAIFASYLIRVRLAENINRNYISYFFQSDIYWNQIVKSKTGVAQPNVNGTKLSNLFIPLPLKEEQDQVVKTLDNLISVCEKIELSIFESLKSMQLATKSLLKKAFEGKIAECTVKEEAAELLIERIKKEKEVYLM